MLFLFIVACPTLGASAYYAVRHASGLDSLFSTFGISRTADDTHAIQDDLRSRDVIAEINKIVPLRAVFSRPEADALARFPHPWRGNGEEMLYEDFRKAATVQQDSKGISTLRIVAFRPEHARDLARALLIAAEQMVNTMNDRARRDTLRNLRDDVRPAEGNVISAQAQLTAFRNREALRR